MFKKIIIILFFSILSEISYSKGLIIEGNEKLSYDDIKVLADIDLSESNFNITKINLLINKLYQSDLILDVKLTENENYYILTILENKIINQIYINKNKWFSDDQIINFLKSKNQSLFSKNNISDDINIIKSMYATKGFNNINVNTRLENYSNDKLNLIYDINEGSLSKLNYIEFFGNSIYSDKYLLSKINSKSIKFYNFFSSGSNLSQDLINFDLSKLKNLYMDDGFLDVDITYSLESNSFGLYKLLFYINEGSRYKILSYNYDKKFNEYDFLDPLIKSFENSVNQKIDDFYNKNKISEYLNNLNELLIENNVVGFYIDSSLIIDSNGIDLDFNFIKQNITPIKKVDISGNSITKDKTIRSKLSIEPGDYFNEFLYKNSKQNLSKYKYIKNVEVKKIDDPEGTIISYLIDEEVKSGNLILAGTFNTDTEFGINFGINDSNILGTGNQIKANFDINTEDVKFDLTFIQYPLSNPNLSNRFVIFNQENDLKSSFGFKSRKRGLGYSINFDYDENIKISSGLSYQFIEGYDSINSDISSVSDNIGEFSNFILDFNINRDTTNSLLYPTNGHYNNLSINISPSNVSDDPFFKLYYTNKNYFAFRESNDYIFFNNNIGLSESFDSKLKTVNSFSLGGNNFKGFDYRGIGPSSNGIYLGGNKIFTSTLGYGSSFLFDEKDNINIKLFFTTGSIWDSDYYTDNEINLRSSIGVSLDFLTAVGPVSFSYAIPFEKNDFDKTRSFSFSIGSSF